MCSEVMAVISYGEVGMHIWIKSKLVTFLSCGQLFLHIIIFTGYTLAPECEEFHKSIMIELHHDLTTALTWWPNTKMLHQFGKEMKFWWCQIGVVCWVIQYGQTKAQHHCSCSHTCLWLSIFMLKERLLHMRMTSCQVMLSAFPVLHSTAQKVNGCASLHEFWIHHAFNVPENREHDFASKCCNLEFF